MNQSVAIGSSSFQFSDFGGQNVPIMPVAGSGGHLAFMAYIRGTGVSSSTAQTLWRVDPQGSLLLLARPGSPAPTPESGVLFSGFGAPSVNQMGDVAFSSYLSGAGVTSGVNNRAWFAYTQGSGFRVMAREGADLSALSLSPDLGAIESTVFPSRDPRRSLAFKSSLVGGGVSTSANTAVMASTGSLAILVRKGDAAPGMSSVQFADPMYTTNEAGQSVVYSYLTGSGVRARGSTTGAVPTDQAIWQAPANPSGTSSLVKVVRAGDAAPGVQGQYFATLFSTSVKPQVNTDGDVAFAASLANANGSGAATGIWTDVSGTLAPVAVSGTPAPGAGSGVTFLSLFSPFGFQHVFACDANRNLTGSQDSVVFAARLGGTGANATNDRAIFRHENGQTQLLMRGGRAVSGTTSDVTIVNSTLGEALRVNRHGVVAANVQLAGSTVTPATDRAIVATQSGVARVVAREGQAIPETDGFVISEIRSTAAMWINALGQVVFTAYAARPSAPTDVRDVILRVDQGGELRAISVAGEIIAGRQGPAIRNGPTYYSTSGALADNGTFVYMGDLQSGGDVVGRSIVAVSITPAAALAPQCPADYNNSGVVSQQDIFDFFTDWAAGAADFDRNGVNALEDLFAFLSAWFAGC